jgi:hypothetical protein
MNNGFNMRRDPWTECIIKKSDERGNVTVADSIIEAFLEKIVQGREIDARVAYEILSARGFLLDFNNNNYKLSNNSLFQEKKIFQEQRRNIRYRENHQYKYYSPTGYWWKNMFKYPCRQETRCNGYKTSWLTFWRRQYGDKISVMELDPFIARLVKSFSSIGLFTWISCDGHGKYGPYVCFDGVYSAVWYEVIFNKFIKKKIRLNCQWTKQLLMTPESVLEDGGSDYYYDYSILQISHPHNDYVKLYLEIQKVAKLLYENRIILREIKKEMINKIWINENYLYKLFKKNSDFANLFESSTKQK